MIVLVCLVFIRFFKGLFGINALLIIITYFFNLIKGSFLYLMYEDILFLLYLIRVGFNLSVIVLFCCGGIKVVVVVRVFVKVFKYLILILLLIFLINYSSILRKNNYIILIHIAFYSHFQGFIVVRVIIKENLFVIINIILSLICFLFLFIIYLLFMSDYFIVI